MSKSALIDGLEWNVRLAGTEQPHLLDTFAATFDEYWTDSEFEDYDPQRDGERLDRALTEERGGGSAGEVVVQIAPFDIHPYGYQSEILEGLAAERKVHGYRRNLVVMATGTGKTVVAALDYRRLRDTGLDSLLFIAHRDEILTQSRATFSRYSVMHRSVRSTSGAATGGVDAHLWLRAILGQSGSRNLDPEKFDVVIKHWFDDRIAVMIYQNDGGERSIRCLWKLDYPLPADIFHDSKVTPADYVHTLFLICLVNAHHVVGLNDRTRWVGCLESRTAMMPSMAATSTQLPPVSELRVLLRHTARERSGAGIPYVLPVGAADVVLFRHRADECS